MRGGALGLIVAVSLLLVLGSSAVSGVTAGSHAAGPAVPAPLVTDQLTLSPHAAVRPLPPATELSVSLTLPFANSGELTRFLAAVQDPASPQYRHFLTASQFESDFGPLSSSVGTVTGALRLAGAIDVSVSGSHAVVSAVLPASSVERLFGISLVTYGSEGRAPLYTALGIPSLPPALAGQVVGIGGLSDGANPYLSLEVQHTAVHPVRGHAPEFVLSNTSNEWFVGSDFTQAYRASDLFPGGTIGPNETFPTHVAIATLLASGYNESTNQNLPGWDPTVVQQYFNDSFPRSWPQSIPSGVSVSVGGISPPSPASFGTLNDSSLDEFENSLDLEMAGSLAPGAALYNFYFAGSLLAGNAPVSDLADDFAIDLQAALAFPYSPAYLGVISGSFGLPDLNDSAWNAGLTEAAATGVTMVMASGDQGNAPNSDTGRGEGQWPVWPSSAAFNTSGSISVGGTSISLNGTATTTWNGTSLNISFDANSTGFSVVSAWWDTIGCPTTCAGTEGGLSTVYPEPYWQLHSAAQPPISATSAEQGASVLGRAGPDVAFPANSTIAYVYADASENVYFTVLEGTSVAAPVFAGLLADVIAAENRSGQDLGMGYLDPEIYRVASFFTAHPGSSTPFLDVTVGQNYVFSAGPGWDATTGWGGLNAPRFLAADENATIASFQYTGPIPGIPTTSNAPIPAVAIYVILGLAVLLAVLLILVFAWPARGGQPPPAPTFGPPGTTYGVAPPPPPSVYGLPPPSPATVGQTSATFLCPYCGSVRSAEPVRCPRCGAL